MKVAASDVLDRRPDLSRAVDEASKLLERVIGPSAHFVTAAWDLTEDDRGHPLIGLEVSDWTGSVGYRFAVAELSNEPHLRRRLHRLWGDLLQVRSHVQLDNILAGSLNPGEG